MEPVGKHPGVCPGHETHLLVEGGEIILFKGILHGPGATHSSTLAWKIPWTKEPGRLQPMGSLRVRHDGATSLSLFTFMHWRRKWQPTPVFLPGESQRRQGKSFQHCPPKETTVKIIILPELSSKPVRIPGSSPMAASLQISSVEDAKG